MMAHSGERPVDGSSATIRPISKGDVHRITSGQVVLDLQTAVKELVENALDAGATNIEVRFKDYGADSFEVIDNGSGIDATNYEGIALKHHTSKLSSFNDLALVQTFGFRGEALSSLCALSQVVIHTATSDESPVGTIIELDRAGSVKSRDRKAARQRGTTVTVTGLFKSLPVRRKEFEKNLKREYAKAQNLLQAYALISKGVRWSSSNHPKGGKKTPQFAVNSSVAANYLSSNVSALFGARVGPTLMPLDLSLSFAPVRSHRESLPDSAGQCLPEPSEDAGPNVEDAAELEGETTVRVIGVISKPTHGSGRSSSDRQFFYINGRPWEAGRVSRAFNEIYKSYNTNQCPFVVADFRLPTDSYDVNVSPDKRTIFLHEEARLVEKVKEKLDEVFAPTRGVFKVGGASHSLRAPALQSKLTGFEPRQKTQPDVAASKEIEEAEDERFDQPENESVGDADEPADASQEEDAETEEVGSSRQRRAGSREVTPAFTAPSDTHSETRDGSEERGGLTEGYDEGAKRPLEATLDTTFASWSPVKRTRISPFASSSQGQATPLSSPSKESLSRSKRARIDLIKSLTTYALPGSQIAEMLKARDKAEDEAAMEVENIHKLEYAEDESDDDVENAEQTSSIIGSDPDLDGMRVAFSEEKEASTACDCNHEEDDGETRGEVDEEDATFDDAERQRNLAALNEAAGSEEETQVSATSNPPFPTPLTSGQVTSSDADTAGTWQVALDLGSLRRRLESRFAATAASTRRASLGSSAEEGNDADLLQDAGVANTDAAAVEASLSRVIHKADFGSMEVIGQFNLGFIIARRRLTPSAAEADKMDDLFIVDQHASDEKFNFETLQLETKIQSQRLIAPRPLELSASDELVASEHVETLKRNGFEVEIEESGMPGRRVKLIAQPVSKGTVFGVKDLEELLYLLRDMTPGSPATMSVRCTKARAMFASRACRKSVMIGTALQHRQMRRILQHMGEIEQPWNCPHGRPTMRHLACLRATDMRPGEESRRHAGRRVDWSKMVGQGD